MDNIMVNESRSKRNAILRIVSFSWMRRNTVVDIICFLFILLFVYAATSKLLDFKNFKFQLGRSPYITNIADFIAWALPPGELIISLLLIFKRTRLAGLYASFALMLLFTGYIYAMLHFSYYLPCSCGGILSNMSWNQHFIFNIIFTLLALTGIIMTLLESVKHKDSQV